MKLTINDKSYDVDMAPLEQRTREQIEKLIEGGSNDTIRLVVKQACNMALPHLGIVKQSRNDDPIRLVIDKLATLIFNGLESSGIALTGQEIKAAPAAISEGNSSRETAE